MSEILNDDYIIKLNHGCGVVTYDDIHNTIISIAENHGLSRTDLDNIKQGKWKAIITEMGRLLFTGDSLRIETADGKTYNNKTYDIKVVERVAKAYIYFSQLYSKYVSLVAFGCFANIPYYTVNCWEDGTNLSDVSAPTLKMISSGQANSIIDKLYDSNNVTGQAMLANNILGWNTSRSNTTQISAKVDDISTLLGDFSILGLADKQS